MTNFPIALGCMGMSGMYGPADEAESIATIHAALDRGIDLLDTGDFYGSGHNEMLIGRALAGRRDRVRLSVKFGALRTPDNRFSGVDTRPVAIGNFLAYSLKRLGTDHIDIYRPSRLDPNVPIEDTAGAIRDFIAAGYVGQLGLSEMGVETIRRAHAVTPVADLQIEYSLISRGPESAIFPALDELGIGVTAYGVLSRGLLTRSQTTARGDFRAALPRFAAGNAKVVDALHALAAEAGATPAQLAIAWVLAQRPNIVPVIGARTRAQLTESLRSLDLKLSPADLARISSAVTPADVEGPRYDPHQMKMLDSEK